MRTSGGSRISKRGVLIYCCARIFRSHAHFQSFLRQSTSSFSPIDLFSNEFLLKHSKVSHSSSFLSSVARKGGSIYLSSVYFLVLVLGVAKRGVPVHPWIPLWIRHCIALPNRKRRRQWLLQTLAWTTLYYHLNPNLSLAPSCTATETGFMIYMACHAFKLICTCMHVWTYT